MPRQASSHGHDASGGGGYPAHYARPPVAPGSLSPVAMNALGGALATGPQSAQPVRSHPTVRTGMAILLAGTLIGGLCGITVRARQSAAEAAVAVQERAREQQAAALAPPPSTALPAPAPTSVPFGSLVTSPPPAQRVASIPPPVTRPVQKHAASTAKAAGIGGHPSSVAKVSAPAKEKDDGYRIASAGNDEPKEAKIAMAKEPKEAKIATAKEPKEAKIATAKEPKEAKIATAKEANKPEVPATTKSDDAERVLKAAMGATENTL